MRPQVNDPAEFLHATIARVALGRDAELPAHVVVLAEPVGVVEGRVSEDVVGAEVGMEVAAVEDGIMVFRGVEFFELG